MKINREFYLKSSVELAPLLLGKFLCVADSGGIKKFRIIETEAYYGESDTACHASKGKTGRTSVMYEEGGISYIYLCYGIHHLLNIVSGSKDHPEAVLIRGVDGFNGPGKLTKAMGITTALNNTSLTGSNILWLEDDGFKPEYSATVRIGIGYATQEYRDKLWRFITLYN